LHTRLPVTFYHPATEPGRVLVLTVAHTHKVSPPINNMVTHVQTPTKVHHLNRVLHGGDIDGELCIQDSFLRSSYLSYFYLVPNRVPGSLFPDDGEGSRAGQLDVLKGIMDRGLG
jgi:hypothetical protein